MRRGFECVPPGGCVLGCETPPEGACDPITQCGCAADEGCFGDASGVVACAPAGSARHAEPCTTGARGGGCAARHQCVALFRALGGSGTTRCRVSCTRDDQCPGGGRCAIDLGPVTVCTEACSIFTQSGCAAPTGCQAVPTPDGHYASDCREGGPVARGSACARDAECADGLLCVRQTSSSSARVCMGLCRSSTDCRLDETCVSFTGEVRLDGSIIRVCLGR